MGNRPVQNFEDAWLDQTPECLRHAQRDNEQEKSGAANNGNGAAYIVKATGILK
tara:strand:+ start:25069 stop:25230 length:162 start_codon:yes stop_codon:yes gene_type:complete